MTKQVLLMDAGDNVGVVLEEVDAGDICVIDGRELTALEPVPFPHKIAVHNIPAGQPVLKYGQKIGYATEDIRSGQWVHRHNVVSERGR